MQDLGFSFTKTCPSREERGWMGERGCVGLLLGWDWVLVLAEAKLV